jgi:hypothetical protein
MCASFCCAFAARKINVCGSAAKQSQTKIHFDTTLLIYNAGDTHNQMNKNLQKNSLVFCFDREMLLDLPIRKSPLSTTQNMTREGYQSVFT